MQLITSCYPKVCNKYFSVEEFKIKRKDKSFAISLKNSQTIIDEKIYDISIDKINSNELSFTNGETKFNAQLHNINWEQNEITLYINGKRVTFEIHTPIDIFLSNIGIDTHAKTKIKNIKASMPGLISKVLVQENQEVETGETLFILEAMKMENVFKAPMAAKIKKINMQQGDTVVKNQELIQFE